MCIGDGFNIIKYFLFFPIMYIKPLRNTIKKKKFSHSEQLL